ncbi:MAG TPA: PAS domain-containing protein, partial [Proteobacteria bacterium]|nr:PAS domain-containing protein [Pseudomonadota bacterium]
MAKEERLGFSFRFLLVNIFVLASLALLALLIYAWRLWELDNIKSLDPLQLGLLAVAIAILVVSLIAHSTSSGYRRHLKKFHKALFEAQKSPEPIETKGTIRELKTIANDLNRIIEVWDKHFQHKEKELRKDIEVERQKLENIWENMPDGVILIDTHYNIEFANQAIKELLGEPPENIRCFEYFENLEDPCELCQLQESMETGKPQRIIKELRDIKGQKHYFECTGMVLFDQDDNPIGALITLKDITRWMDMDNLLEDQTKELEETKERLSDALQKLEAAEKKLKQSDELITLGALCAEIIHEIINPINFIHAGVQNTMGHVQALLGVFEAYEKLPLLPRARAEIERIKRSTNIEQVLQDLDQSIRNSMRGIERVKELVQALRIFASPG